MDDSGVRCTIAQHFIGDVEKGWCRLHPEMMKEIDVSSGDAVLVSDGNHSAAYYAHSVDEEPRWAHERDEQSIHLDFHAVTGEPSSETKGQEVVVRPITPSPARSVVYQDLPSGTASEIVEHHTQNKLLGTLAVVGARIWIAYLNGDSGRGSVGLEVYETDPKESSSSPNQRPSNLSPSGDTYALCVSQLATRVGL